ncbi:MAG: reverse transcriptase-like protein [Deltaproteobacteria bacterium]|nr:reverse transcriptase-like protein [Deltaproteobacteria bacterium]
MNKDKTEWKRMKFKGNKVWVATGHDGKSIVKDGKVLVKYQIDQDYEYRVHKNGVKPVDSPESENIGHQKNQSGAKSSKKHKSKQRDNIQEEKISDDTICIYTDGACSGNPGPSGIGALLLFRNHEKEISKHIGIATNNIAELEAIRVALLEIKKTDLPVRVFTDSSYAYGVLTLGWKAKKNLELIISIKKIIAKFKELKFIKVKGHEGVEGNEKADFLATSALKKKI